MSHCHLSLRERLAIEQMLLFGLSRREISRRLGRHHSTIGTARFYATKPSMQDRLILASAAKGLPKSAVSGDGISAAGVSRRSGLMFAAA